MGDARTLVDSLRRRICAYSTNDERRGVLSDQALVEEATLVRLVDYAAADNAGWKEAFTEALEVVAQLHWARYLASGRADRGDAVAAGVLFLQVHLFAPDSVPNEFRTYIPADYHGLWEPVPGLLRSLWSRQADVLAWRAVETQTAEGLDEAVYLLERILAATAEDDESRAQCLFNLGVALQARCRYGNDERGLGRALEAVNQSLSGVRSTDEAFATRSAGRASIRLDLYVHTGELDHLSQAVEEYADVIDSIRSDHVDRPGHMVNFAEASRLLFEQTKDPNLADRAIAILAELGRELRRRGEPFALAHGLLARLLTTRFAGGRPPDPSPPLPEAEAAHDAVTSPVAWRSQQTTSSGKRRRLERALRKFEQSGDPSVLDDMAVRQAAADVLVQERRRCQPLSTAVAADGRRVALLVPLPGLACRKDRR